MSAPPAIAVTGASGHIGNAVCRELLDRGYAVRALCRTDTRALEGLPLETVPGDVFDAASLERLLHGCRAVVHCAAVISIHGDPDGSVFRTNTEGTANVLRAAQHAGVRRLVHLSSVHAVEELPHHAPFDENRPYKTAAASAYDYSKAVGEQLLLNTGPDAPEIVVLRPSAVIGPYDFKPSELGKALLDFRRRAIPALPEGGYDFVDVRDVARSVAQALEQGRPGEVYLLTGLYYTMKQFAQAVQDVTGIPTARLVLPYPLLKLLAPPIAWWAALRGAKPLFSREAIDALKHGHPRMDHGKAARELGHRSRPPEQSIRDFYTWYDTHTSRP